MKVTDLHREAMALYDEAQRLLQEAWRREAEAANMLREKLEDEPSRSVLYRSAASMAMQCGELREAERLIAIGLGGNPPEGIIQELRDVYQMVSKQLRQRRRALKRPA